MGVEFRILGPLEVLRDGEPQPLGTPKQRSLLALLLLRRGQVVSSDAIVDQLWGAEPPPTAANALQGHVSRLRKLLGPNDIGARSSRPQTATGWTARPTSSTRRASSGSCRRASRRPAAVAMPKRRSSCATRSRSGEGRHWPTSPSSRCRARGHRLRSCASPLLEERIAAELAVGRHAEVVAELTALAADHPVRERLHAQLMLALYRSGRQADALAAYRRARDTLVDELGLEVGDELRELERAILAQDPELRLEPPPELRAALAPCSGDRARRPRARGRRARRTARRAASA